MCNCESKMMYKVPLDASIIQLNQVSMVDRGHKVDHKNVTTEIEHLDEIPAYHISLGPVIRSKSLR